MTVTSPLYYDAYRITPDYITKQTISAK